MTRHPVAVILSALLLLATPLTHSRNLMSNDTGRYALDIKVNEVNTDPPDATTASLAIDKVLTSNADEDGSRDVSKGDTGKLKYVMRENPIPGLHPMAMGASQAAFCEILWDTHHQVLTEDRWQSLPLTVGWHWRQSRYNSRLGFNGSFQA